MHCKPIIKYTCEESFGTSALSYWPHCEFSVLKQHLTIMDCLAIHTHSPFHYCLLSLGSQFHPICHLQTVALSATNFSQIKKINRRSSCPQGPLIFLFPITPCCSWAGKVPGHQQWQPVDTHNYAVSTSRSKMCHVQATIWSYLCGRLRWNV